MHFFVVSFSHKNSSAAFRDTLSFSDESRKKEFMQRVFDYNAISELLLLSTCNRFELIGVSKQSPIEPLALLAQIATHTSCATEELKERADIFVDLGAIHHIFSVASSLDSLVLGETQIVGQIRDAMALSKSMQMFGPLLHQAFTHAFKCAAQVRTQTNISKNPVSVASVAVAKAKEEAGELDNRSVLIIGVGEMSELTMKYCLNANAKVSLMNRTYEKACALAESFHVDVIAFEQLADVINEFDIIFSSTSSNTPIITQSMLLSKPTQRYWFDLAIPRDIEIEKDRTIALFRVDDLSSIANENIALREDEAKLSFLLIEEWVELFDDWMTRQALEPLIKSIYERAHHSVEQEVQRGTKKGYIDNGARQNIEKLALQSMKRFLHPIIENIRTKNLHSDEMIDILHEILTVKKDT